jgi:hypothetical protein
VTDEIEFYAHAIFGASASLGCARTEIYGTGIGGRITDDICSPCWGGGGATGNGSG